VLTVSVPLSEGAQITSNTHNPSPPETKALDKPNAFAGKLDQALSDKTTAGEARTAENLRKPGKEMKSGKKSPKSSDTPVSMGRDRNTGRKISGKAVARHTHSGFETDTDASLAGRKGVGAAMHSDSQMQLLSLHSRQGESDLDGVENNLDSLGTQTEESPSAIAADQKALTSEDGAAPQVFLSAQTKDPGEMIAGSASIGVSSDGKGNKGDTRVSTKGENGKTVIEVRDFRTRKAGAATQGSTPAETVTVEAGDEGALETERESADPQIRLVRFPSGDGAGSETATDRTTRSAGFSAYVRENLSSQIVKQSGIILRNNNSGEIRLVLKPEHLGRVRLRIQLDENRLTGRIFVDSSFVKESFEQNLESLYRAFRNSGFEASGFEVLVDGGGAEDGTQKDPGKLAAKTLKQLDDAVPILEEIDQQSELINLVI
jgi:flagellar protein FlbC